MYIYQVKKALQDHKEIREMMEKMESPVPKELVERGDQLVTRELKDLGDHRDQLERQVQMVRTEPRVLQEQLDLQALKVSKV